MEKILSKSIYSSLKQSNILMLTIKSFFKAKERGLEIRLGSEK